MSLLSTPTRSWPLRPRPHAAIRRLATIALLLSPLASAAQRFPYIPTNILLPDFLSSERPNGSDFAYILQPGGSDSSTTIELLALNISSTIDGDSALETISSDLPFLDGASESTAFQPTIADNGTIIVQAGDCHSNTYDIWTYTPPVLSSGSAKASWERTKAVVPTKDDGDGEDDAGPFFLGASIAFSSTLAPDLSEPVIYSFGGVCASPSSDESAWRWNGTYSNRMVRLSPPDQDKQGENGYTASFIPGRGPAFPEAGFTLTPLGASITNRSGTLTQSQNYVLLGGHTEHAFINMSTAAIWSLPEESWTFLSINGAAQDGPGSELAIKDVSRRETSASVDSRSGHTAVVNEKGDAIIIMGGWVGSVSNPAEPQLAVLRIGDSYGDWVWDIPDDQPEGFGIYGHAAALLPGNVMMTYGGYEISDTEEKLKKRQGSGASPRFLNLTSMSWGSEYRNPNSGTGSAGSSGPSSGGGGTRSGSSSSSSSNSDDGSSDTRGTSSGQSNMKKIGLGVGLGVGFAAIIGAVLVWFCYRRRLQKKRRERDDTVRGLAQDATRFLHADDEMVERDDPWMGQPWYTGGHDPYDQGVKSLGYETLRGSRNTPSGGLGRRPPLGLHIPRKPVHRAARGAYQPAGSSMASGSGQIHPIYEADEEDPDEARRGEHNTTLKTPTSPTYSDPFMTPPAAVASTAPATYFPLGRAALTPSPDRERRTVDPEVQDWQSDMDAAEALLAQMPPRSRTAASAGRISPTRRGSVRSAGRSPTPADDERTISGLSDSNRSVLSSLVSRSGSNSKQQSMLRGSPTTSGAQLLVAGASGAAAAAMVGNNDGRLGTSGSGSSSSNNTFSTAKSTFPALQAEGPALLHRGGGGRYRRGSSYPDADDEDEILVPGSPSKNKPRRQLGWLGSLRRVFSVTGGGASSSGESSRSISPIRQSSPSLEGGDDNYEPRSLGLSGIGGAELLRRKQGRRGWDEAETDEHGNDKFGGGGGGVSKGGDRGASASGEDDWDIERAIEKRLVQVMFTVPRERLRVVNGGEEELDLQEEKVVLVDPEMEAAAAAVAAEEQQHDKPRDRRVVDIEDPEKRALFEEEHLSAPSPEPLRIHKIGKEAGTPTRDLMVPRRGEGNTADTRREEQDDPWAPAPGRLSMSAAAAGEEMKRRPSPVSAADTAVSTQGEEEDLAEPRPSLTLRTAEAVKFERPRTRVLEMVESLETKSRDSSPLGGRSGRGTPRGSPKR